MKDFNVQIKVRNGRLLRRIRERHENVAEFARKFGLSYERINKLVTLARVPVSSVTNDWLDGSLDIAAALGCDPEELWPDHMRRMKARRATAEIEMDAVEVAALSDHRAPDGARQLIEKWSDGLTPREQRVLALRFFDNATLEETAQEINVTRERVRQIECKALRKLKRKARIDRVEKWEDVE